MSYVKSEPIDSTKFYLVYEPTFMCCDESQFKYVCKAHGESMGCMFCVFNPDEPCEC